MNIYESCDQNNGLEIAVISLVGQFPEAKNIEEFWQNLYSGKESISFLSEQELQASGIASEVFNDPNYVNAKGVLDGIEWLDANFFGFNPREAQIIDPQHRLFLECAWEALEKAGYDSKTYQGLIGVYAGASMNTYLTNNIYSHPDIVKLVGNYQMMITNDKDYLPTRVSYKLDLKGPSIAVQTACSTSLVAVHLACQGLLSGECDMALAGAVSILLPQKAGYLYQEGGIGSPDGHCRAFDAKAQGTVGGEGVGIVVLKRLVDAIADGDYIYALIKGSAINNDGGLKVGYTAPHEDGQAQVIRAAHITAGVEPETITYLEAHGTGTALGDPIEITALTKAFRTRTQKIGFCAIGSVKPNIGHLDAAAGIASLIKTILALQHKSLPPSLNFNEPNPQIDFANSPFYVNTTASEWQPLQMPRRAGVSSFGIGGTNAHVILEEAPVLKASSSSRPWQLLLLSAKTNSALEAMTTNLVESLQQHPEKNFADIAYTLQVGRRAFEYRRMLVCSDRHDAIVALEAPMSQKVWTHFQEATTPPSIVFMFPGQGAQYVNMARELYQIELTFRVQVDSCSELLKPILGLDIRQILYPEPEQVDVAAQQLKQTEITQPALFVIEYALAQVWLAWGILPQIMIGHSIGEYVAACLAGVFSLEDALKLVALRGQIMQQLPKGAMLAVSLSQQELQPFLNYEISLAASNGPSLCVVSGSVEAIDALQQHFSEIAVECRCLHTSHAFHSKMMSSIVAPFTQYVRQLHLQPPQIPYLSNVTGTWITAAQATDPSYWAQHLVSPVRFSEGASQLLQESNRVFLEVGPGRTLSTLVKSHSHLITNQTIVTSLRHPQFQESDVAFLLKTLGQLWLVGVQINWSTFYVYEQRKRVPLPTYSFERQYYWVSKNQLVEDEKQFKLTLNKNLDITDWFYIPSWIRSSLFATVLQPEQNWLVFVDDWGLGWKVIEKLQQQNQKIVTVIMGDKFHQINDDVYTIQPHQREDYDSLFAELQSCQKIPQCIVHLWSITSPEYYQLEINRCKKSQEISFDSLLLLAQSLEQHNITDALQIEVITNNLQNVTGEENLFPEKATVLGLCKVLPQDYPNITCRHIDIVISKREIGNQEKLVNQITTEISAKSSSDFAVAYRGSYRWIKTFASVKIESNFGSTSLLRENAVYLIINGLDGDTGYTFARYLAQTVKVKLILITDSAFPEKDRWEEWLTLHDQQDDTSQKIQRVKDLEALGARVVVLTTDFTNEQQIQQTLVRSEEYFGSVKGVIYTVNSIQEKYFKTIGYLEKNECEQYLHTKVSSILLISKILKNKQLDFCIFVSSLSSILGGRGLIADTAINLVTDAIAHQNSQTTAGFWISVNWDSLHMMATTNAKSAQDLNITRQEAAKVLEFIFRENNIKNNISQIIISTNDLQLRLKQYNRFSSETKLALHARPQLRNTYVSPVDDLERNIAKIWQDLLGIEKVGIYDNFFEIGGHSLLAVNLLAEIQKLHGQKLPLSTFIERGTIDYLAQILRQQSVTSSWSPLVEIQKYGDKTPFFCIHPIGGNVLCYVELARCLGTNQPFYGLQAPGLDGETKPLTQIEEMAAYYLEALRVVQPHGPYFLGGWSFGGIVAFEMAQQLQQKGQQVAQLILIDSWAPIFDRKPLEADSAALLAWFAKDLGGRFGKKLAVTIEDLKFLEPKEQLNYVVAQAKKANIMPENNGISQIRRLLDLCIINLKAERNYVPQLYPNKIILFTTHEQVEGITNEWTRGWVTIAKDVEAHIIRADHYSIIREQNAQILAEKMKPYLSS
ncbi:type I polyketide synthase [Nostoc sphaeroides]|uniref:Beta-ketoacyl synthase n=1 Tax=Nostoc sphaeroides CCNUC1 TaxID=2653204 RepID=A0A5P8WIH4_9NOSO|nr:type I polyketide synthase [Nostoc sphaeroides]QFS52514.1 beta-ketoacyl synthase [Nostoc sphaeroides CCNUC1]